MIDYPVWHYISTTHADALIHIFHVIFDNLFSPPSWRLFVLLFTTLTSPQNLTDPSKPSIKWIIPPVTISNMNFLCLSPHCALKWGKYSCYSIILADYEVVRAFGMQWWWRGRSGGLYVIDVSIVFKFTLTVVAGHTDM